MDKIPEILNLFKIVETFMKSTAPERMRAVLFLIFAVALGMIGYWGYTQIELAHFKERKSLEEQYK